MWNRVGDKNVPAACSDEISFKEHLDAVNDDYLVACVDIGHAEMDGLNTSAAKMILTLGDKVKCLHIHDNDLHNDSHLIPFSMNIDFGEVVRALKIINYGGYLTLEADRHLETYGYKDNPDRILDGVKELYASADRLRKLFGE